MFVEIEILLYKFAKYKHLQRFVMQPYYIIIANIEGGKLACARTHNRTIIMDFHISSHK